MPVGGEAIRFGPVGDALSRVVVPWVRTTGERRCAIVSAVSVSLFLFPRFSFTTPFFFFPSAFRGVCVGWVLRVCVDDGDEGNDEEGQGEEAQVPRPPRRMKNE